MIRIVTFRASNPVARTEELRAEFAAKPWVTCIRRTSETSFEVELATGSITFAQVLTGTPRITERRVVSSEVFQVKGVAK